MKPLEQKFYLHKVIVKIRRKKFKEVEVTLGKTFPDLFPRWTQIGYEWGYEEIYSNDFSTLTKAMEEDSF
ncbi:hypothetical protein ACEWET_11445 [Paraliobacillus sp. JSM ZJ581]